MMYASICMAAGVRRSRAVAGIATSGLQRAMSTVGASPAAEARKAGSLYVWGKVEDGKLGMKLPDTMFRSTEIIRGPAITPTLNPNLKGVKQVVCRGSKTLALTEDGSVYSWGMCENLSLGHGEGVTKVGLPKRLEALQGIKIVQIDAGETASAAVSEEGEVFTWGWGGSFWQGNGGLGHGDNVTQPRPALVEWLADNKLPVSQLSVGSSHMLALTKDGKVLSWGSGKFGRCGNGNSDHPTPTPVELLESERCVQVAAGKEHSFAVTAAGKLYGWGKNEASQLGLGASMVMDLNTMEAYPTAVELEGDDAHLFNGRVARVAAGHAHTVAVTRDGQVFQWGARTFITPTLVPTGYFKPQNDEDVEAGSKAAKENAVPLRAVQVAAGEGVSAVLDASGQLFTWGKMAHSAMLGHKAYGFGTRHPTRVDSLVGVPLSQVSFGSQHAAAVVGIPASL